MFIRLGQSWEEKVAGERENTYVINDQMIKDWLQNQILDSFLNVKPLFILPHLNECRGCKIRVLW